MPHGSGGSKSGSRSRSRTSPTSFLPATLSLKVAWEGDDESLHEGDALELWDGDGAVRLLRRSGRALLEERAVPGNDLSGGLGGRGDGHRGRGRITAVAACRVSIPTGRAGGLALAGSCGARGSELVPLARQLLAELEPAAGWLVHGDFHHHNLLRSGDEFVAIDPKPYLADREYDPPSFLWNPLDNRMEDREQTERRIAAFVGAGLDEFRLRAWTVIRGAY